MKLISFFALLSVVALAFVTPASADTIAVTNPSFETPAALPLSCGTCGVYNVGNIPGWIITGGEAGLWQPGPASFSSVPDGSTVAYSNGGTISQALSASLAPNTTYTLSVDVGHRLDGPNGFATDYTLALLAGSMVLSLTDSNGIIPMGTFANESFSYTTGSTVSSGNLGIRLSSTGPQADFDNVRLTANAVPEPGSLVLLASGLGLALFLFRRS